MPSTQAIALADIADWHNVAWALGRACKGKRRTAAVQGLLHNTEQAIAGISGALRAGKLPVGEFRAFEIQDPKRRLIHAAPIEDRVAHHALMRYLEPQLETILLPSVFACRINKGVHKAVYYAQQQSRRFPWLMHLDIKSYFPAINQQILQQQLRKRFRGDGLQLINAVIQAFGQGQGLPIGALTSQHFANHYLNVADRWALAQPEVMAHCRYMDDFLFWGQERSALLNFRDKFTHYLQQHLALQVKPALIQRSAIGLKFCGIHIKPHALRPSQRRRRRFRSSVQQAENNWLKGEINSLSLQQHYAAAQAILLPADAPHWRAKCLAKGIGEGALEHV